MGGKRGDVLSGYSATSQHAYQSVDLDRREREVLSHIQAHFPTAEFTRAELADSMGWKINRICGRVVSLRDKGLLTEDKARTVRCNATGGDAHPLKINGDARAQSSIGVGVTNRNGGREFSPPNATAASIFTSEDSHVPRESSSALAAAPDTYSEAHRHQCEIRHVANLPNDSARNRYLTGVHEKRGELAWKRLRQAVWDLMRAAA